MRCLERHLPRKPMVGQGLTDRNSCRVSEVFQPSLTVVLGASSICRLPSTPCERPLLGREYRVSSVSQLPGRPRVGPPRRGSFDRRSMASVRCQGALGFVERRCQLLPTADVRDRKPNVSAQTSPADPLIRPAFRCTSHRLPAH